MLDNITQTHADPKDTCFRTLAETTDAMLLILQGSQLCYVNQKVEAVTGFTREELLAHPDVRQILNMKERANKNEQQKTELPQHQEVRILTKGGEDRWLDWSVVLFQFQGQPAKLVTAIDITKRKHSEIKLRQVIKQEKELGELRAKFVCMMSHELRNPLHIISFSTSSLKRHRHQWDEEKQLKYLHRIQKAVEHLNDLMDNTLIIGRSDAGKLSFEPKILDLAQFCRDLVAQLQMSHARQHTLNFTHHGDCSAVYVDEKLLQPVLTNLIDNAIKYSPNNSTVTLQLSCVNEEVVVSIEDRGVGILPEDRQRLFEPFHRGKNVSNINGNGLGLAVVKKLIDLHQGQISVQSEVGVGTTFTISLPSGKLLSAQKFAPPIIAKS